MATKKKVATKATGAPAESVREVVRLRPMALKRFTVGIRSRDGSPLAMHRFGKKARDQIRNTKLHEKKRTREKLDAAKECREALYLSTAGWVGIPIHSIKKACEEAAHKDIGFEKTLVRKGFFIISDGISKEESPRELVRIRGKWKQREDVVRVPKGGKADLRYRPIFEKWDAKLVVEYDSELLTSEAIVNLIQRAGFGVGVGEWRPEKSGTWGRFEVKR